MKFYFGDNYFENFINKWPDKLFLLSILKFYDKEILRFQFSEPDDAEGCGIRY